MKASILNLLNNMKLRNKLMVSFVVVVFVPVLIVGIYLTMELRQTALKDAVEQTSLNIERVKKRTSEVLIVPTYISHNLNFDSQLQQLVNKKYQTQYEIVDSYNNYTTFGNYIRSYNQVKSIRFYNTNQTMLNNWEFIPLTIDIVNTQWFRSAYDGQGLIGWYYIADETKKDKKYLSLVRRINFLKNKSNGMLVITVNTDFLNKILSQEEFPTMIVDENNNIISSNRVGFLDKRLSDIIAVKNAITEYKGTFEGVVEGKASQIIIDSILPELSLNELRIVSVISNDSIVKDANRFSIVGLIVISLSIIIASILIYYFSKLISNRLLTLRNQINLVAEGDFKTTVIVDGKDEIGQLSNQFNIMVDNIRKLIDEVHQTNEQKNALENKQTEIKLKMMASQINPHFLFNALESIRMKAHIKGEKEISQVVKLLGKLMRKSIEVGGKAVLLKDEIEMVRCYLQIQQFRYDDRLEFELSVDPQSENIQIPPLIIQPLVENAVIHGLEYMENGGKLRVKTLVEGDRVLVKVSDNGIGISKEKQQEIDKSLNNNEEKDGNRIGLRNVHYRLQLIYGMQAGLSIDSEQNVGTTIYFYIPRRQE